MADEATKAGDATKAERVHPGRRDHRQPADQRRDARSRSSKTMALQATAGRRPGQGRRAAERPAPPAEAGRAQKLLGQLDQAKMQEQMNKAMASLSETVGEDVPTLDEVRDKIEARYAKAKGMSELNEHVGRGRMLEIEQASLNIEAQARLTRSGPSSASAAPPPRSAPEPPTSPSPRPSSHGPTDRRRRGEGPRRAAQHRELTATAFRRRSRRPRPADRRRSQGRPVRGRRRGRRGGSTSGRAVGELAGAAAGDGPQGRRHRTGTRPLAKT